MSLVWYMRISFWKFGICILLWLLNKNKDVSNKIVKTELLHYRKIHQAERYEKPELFKRTKISLEEKLENLFVLPSNENNKTASVLSTAMLDLPTNEE